MEHRERESGPGRLRVLLAVGVTGLLVSSAMGAVDTLWLRKFWGVDSAAPFIFNRVADMCTDSKGYVYVCGSGEHPAPTSHANMLLAKYNQWGETLWMRSIDGNTYSPDDIAHAIAVDSVGNVYVAGTTRNVITAILQDGYDITWGKFDSSGNMISVNKLRVGYPEDDCAYDIVIGKRGDVYICGAVGIDTTTYFGSAFFVMRTRTDSLYPMWVRGYVLDSAAFRSKERRQQSRDRHPDFIYWDDWQDWDNCAAAMEVGPDSCLVVVGYGLHRTREYEAWTMKFRDSTRLWEDQEYYRGADRDDALFDVAVARNGYIYATGIGTGWTDDYDAYTLRYAPTGGSPAEEVIPGSNQYDDYGCAICLDDASPLQNVYVCGYEDVVGSGYQAFTQKYTAGLSPRWGSAGALYGRGGASNEHAFDVAYHRGRVYVTGIAGQDMFVAAYDTLNTQPHDTLWSYKWNGPFNEQDMGAAVCVVDTDHVYAGGQYDRPSMAGYVNDLFLMRLGTPRPDLRAELVVAPTETTAYGATVTPRVRFVNDGNMRAVFWTKLWIGTGYRDSIGHGTWLYPGDSVTLSFADWTALPEGWAAVRCSLAYPGDIDPSDNVLLDSTFVVRRDVGCLRIVAPAGTVDSGGTLQPQAWLRNWGNAAQTFDAVMRVGPSYCDTVTVAVGAGDSALQAFAGWTPGQRGTWPVKCTTVLATDVNPGNNWREGTVTVRVVDMAMLGIMAPPARVDSGRPVTPRVRIGNYGSEPTTTWIFCRLDDGTDVVVYSESAQATV
ncbi:hypothetical protein FJY71_04765, partial [candidate division WOR-3 bacterium]|nr:hypothetical protein [candidate division WOR-3 bacterium]